MKLTFGLNPLAKHNTKILFWATLFASVSFLEPVLVLFYLARGLNAGNIFVLLLCFSISILVFELPTGAFADRFGPKASFLVGTGVDIISKLLLIFAHDPWMFYLSQVLHGLAGAFFSGADETLIYESLKEAGQEDRMSSVWGKIESASYIPMIASFLIGGFVAKDLLNWEFILLIGAGTAFHLASFFILFRVKNPAISDSYREHPFHHVRDGIGVIKRNPNLVKLFLNFTVVFIPTIVFTKFDQPYFTGAGLPVPVLGILYAAAAAMSFLLSQNIAWLEKRMSRVAIMYSSGILTGAMLLVASLFIHQLVLAFFVFFIVKMTQAVRFPIYSHLSNAYIDSGSRATTISLLSILDSVMDIVIFSTLSLTAGFGLGTIFLGCSLVVFAGLLFPVREARTN
ncbi:MAG TPA: MFS transporter [Bacillales bacterium]|nr:MFS transporter [Bacillales bacterium]